MALRHRAPASILLLSLFAAACGGGGGTTGSTSGGAGIGNGVSVGTITGFGSVFIDDVRYNTDAAAVMRSGTSVADVTELSIGMKVTLQGDLSGGVADSVSFEEDVKGPVDQVNGTTIIVMGQTVLTGPGTVFNNVTLGSINAGDILEVSGSRTATDLIDATFVERKIDPLDVDKYTVIGTARGIDTVAKTFIIDNLSVDYSMADVGDLTGGNPTTGQLLEVHDANKAYVSGALMMAATKVEPQNPLGDPAPGIPAPGNALRIEAIVVDATGAPATFVISGGIVVQTTPNTVFLFGVATDIALGSALQIEGTVDAAGVLTATRVKFRHNAVRMEALVEAVDVAGETLTVLGVPVSVPASSRLEDKRDDEMPFTLAELALNDYVRIRGFIGANGRFIATELERDNTDSDARIRAVASAKDAVAGTVMLLGLTIATDSATQFRDVNDAVVTAAAFFDALAPGTTTVQAKWDPFVDASGAVREIEIEN